MNKKQLEIERRWLLPNNIENEIFNKGEVIRITQHYLNNEKYNERIRQIVYPDFKTIFMHTIKKPMVVGNLETEKEISSKEYIKLLSRVNLKSNVIIKDRSIIPYERFMIEIDRFIHPITFCILEIEIPTIETEIVLPDYIKNAIEITKNKALSNYKISLNSKKATRILNEIYSSINSNHLDTSS